MEEPRAEPALPAEGPLTPSDRHTEMKGPISRELKDLQRSGTTKSSDSISYNLAICVISLGNSHVIFKLTLEFAWK